MTANTDSSAMTMKPRGHARSIWLGIVLVVLAVTVSPVRAQTPETGAAISSPPRMPRLHGHTFVPSAVAHDPFITTFVRNNTGLGQASRMNNPALVVGDETLVNLRGSLTFIGIDFEYRQRIQPWLAIWLSLDAKGRLGTNVNTLLAQGVQAFLGFEMGWLMRLVETKRLTLSGSVNLWNSGATVINIADWLDEILEDGTVGNLVRNNDSLRGGGGATFAYGLSRLFGFTINTTVGYGEALDRRGDDGVYVQVDGGVSMNLRPQTSVPLGLFVGGELSSFPSSGQDLEGSSWTLGGRISYTGEDDFNIGLELGYTEIPRAVAEETVKVASGGLDLRYYF